MYLAVLTYMKCFYLGDRKMNMFICIHKYRIKKNQLILQKGEFSFS